MIFFFFRTYCLTLICDPNNKGDSLSPLENEVLLFFLMLHLCELGDSLVLCGVVADI